MSHKPTIVLVPGAWHKVFQYSPLISRLQDAGYEVHGVDYPSVSANPTSTNFDPDVVVVRERLASIANQNKDIVLVVHSIGGLIGSEAASGFSKTDRSRKGEAGGIIKMAYLAAWILPEGPRIYRPPPWHSVEGSIVKPLRPQEIFYNCCAPEVAEENIPQLLPIAKGVLESVTTYAAWKHIPSIYLMCKNDNAIPFAMQESFMAQEGSAFEVFRCDADHSPFLSMPEYTAKFVRHAAGEAVDFD